MTVKQAITMLYFARKVQELNTVAEARKEERIYKKVPNIPVIMCCNECTFRKGQVVFLNRVRTNMPDLVLATNYMYFSKFTGNGTPDGEFLRSDDVCPLTAWYLAENQFRFLDGDEALEFTYQFFTTTDSDRVRWFLDSKTKKFITK